MKTKWIFTFIIGTLLMFTYGCAQTPGSANMTKMENHGARTDVLYSCACGAGCDCNTVSTKPGTCRCGKPLEWGHVVRVEGDVALVCTCAEGCTCKQDAADPGKCGCGKPLKRVSLAGTGLFFCNCGGSCSCNTVSGAAGKCKCGMPLKQE
ncbi:hypothetical protein [Geopsychrobacter electrodiphilus]|uniref:hypothetical protein n=1 Tax=Geopsychrobacter electrodiphilus TaxID=225196 RepID=UPI0003781B18|nr:hypothetical protein [Geopsychrobacter electrodiphilus]